MKELYTSRVHVVGGRDGSVTSSDGLLSLKLGFPQAMGGAGDRPNPEQLFAAGYAACFASSGRAAAAALSHPAHAVEIDAEATVSAREDGSYLVSKVRLRVHGLGEGADAVLAEAKRICAYSNATRGNVELDVAVA